jgi:putative flippase GtrA
MSIPKVIRYIVSGGSGAVVNIGTLYVLTRAFGVWYLTASVVAFIVSFFVSFGLQRFWTFEHRSSNAVLRHASLYLLVALCNLCINTFIVYMAVEYAGMWYVLAQLFAGIIVSVYSFFLYRTIFFTSSEM